MPKPSSEWLQEDIATYRLMGMDKIISLLTSEEIKELGLDLEAEFCRNQGINFVRHPILDRSVADKRFFAGLAQEIFNELIGGVSIGIHCRGGIGRSGMLACCVLMLRGLAADEAIAIVSKARGVQVPDTQEQAQFIRNFHGQRAEARPSPF